MELPNEYEWEKAARSNTGNIYPWGDAISHERANYWFDGGPGITMKVGSFNGSDYVSNGGEYNFTNTPNALWTTYEESFGNGTASLYVNYYEECIGGLQMEFSGSIDNCYGGSLIEAGFMVSVTNNIILAFSFSGNCPDNGYLEPLLVCEGNFGELSDISISGNGGSTIDDIFYVGVSSYTTYTTETVDSPSPFGIYDLSGNVFEWVKHELFDSNLRMVKGGSFTDSPSELKAYNSQLVSSSSQIQGGFRCIRRLPQGN